MSRRDWKCDHEPDEPNWETCEDEEVSALRMRVRADQSKELLKLAIATRERIDEGVLEVYLDDLEEAEVTRAVLANACFNLRRTAAWFPKVSELLEQCRKSRRAAIESEEDTIRVQGERASQGLPIGPVVNPERHQQFLDDIKQIAAQKVMR